jgi:predicted nuclease of predicted toxin-antitoxin system
MRFLIDENLSPTLVDLARERGYEAMAVRDLGLLNAKDWTLLEKVQDEDWTLVTNNFDEFRRRYARKVTLHAGVVFLVDVDAGRHVQRLAFAAALDEIDANADLVNLELLVESRGDRICTRRLRLPG